MPRTIVFDAVGTILQPHPDVITAYHDAGVNFGSELSRDEVSDQFKLARRTFFSCDNSAEKTAAGSLPSSEKIEYDLWHGLVHAIFHEVLQPQQLFEQLWDHFASPANWKLYDDVADCLTRLQIRGDHLIVASNFDSRLHDIVASIPELQSISSVHCSAEVGFRKPDPEFYNAVSQHIPADHEVIMIGDDLENDCHAPARFGWQGVHLARTTDRKPRFEKSVRSLSDWTS